MATFAARDLVACSLVFVALGCGGGGGSGDGGSESSGAGDTLADSSTADAASSSSSSGGGPIVGACTGYRLDNATAMAFVRNGAAAPTCTMDPAPCASDITGEWTLEPVCSNPDGGAGNPVKGACPGGTFSDEATRLTGTLSVDTSGGYTLTTSTLFDFTMQVDIGCIGAFDCTTDGQDLLAGMSESATCTGGPTDCTCTVVGFAGAGEMLTGTGLVAGGKLTFPDDPTGRPLAYCADGDRLDAWRLTGNLFNDGTPCADDDACSGMDAADRVYVCKPL